MPPITVMIYVESSGRCPLLAWLDEIPERARDKCHERIERLAELGYELRRPEADLLRDGIYELRIGLQGINYRLLYFYHGKAAVITHGITKERAVPPADIELALRRKRQFAENPNQHTRRD